MYRVLLVDGDAKEARARADYLAENGYIADTARTAEQALSLTDMNGYDIILLEVDLPDSSGFKLLQELSVRSDAIVIFLSAETDTSLQLEGFRCGAADFIAKDCPLELFRARVNRCAEFSSWKTHIVRRFNPLVIDLRRRCAAINGETLSLTATEFRLLELMSSRPGTVWSLAELYRSLWGENGDVNRLLVQTHISHLRRKMQKLFPQHDFVETARGKGYQFVPMHANSAL